MKKQKVLLKVVCVALVVAIVVGIIVAVQKQKKAADIDLVDVPVITFFGITGDSTTPADIIKVERDLNNVLLRTAKDAYCVKLFLAPADRYGTMVESARKTVDAYKENEKKKGAEKYGFEYSFDYATSTFSYKCDKDSVTPKVVYNQDTIIEMLDAGQDVFPNIPSIDVMLVTNYDDYYELAQNGELERLNSPLTDIAKSLKQSIPQPFFDALTLNPANTKDIYGIPCVQEVGVYEFMVYDKGILDKYGISKKQLLHLEDLNPYLKKVHEDADADVIPLLNAPLTVPSMELSDDKLFVAVQKSGETYASLEFPYDNDNFVSCYTLISCYRSLGYMSKKGADVTARTEGDIEKDNFAVAFFRGTERDVKQLSEDAEKRGKNLVYNVYSKPFAKSREVGESVFCVCASKKHSLSKPEYGIDFVCRLNAPKSQTDIKNILLYGAAGINYSISDTDGCVVYANENTYVMDNLYTGHTLHAHPAQDKGVSPEWAKQVQEHNRDLVSTEFSDFRYKNKVISKEDTEGKLGKKGETVEIEVPDYAAVVKREMDRYDAAGDYYDSFVNGYRYTVAIDDEFQTELYENIRKKTEGAVQKDYEIAQKKDYAAKYEAEIRANDKKMEIYRMAAVDSTRKSLKAEIRQTLENQKRTEYKNLGTEMTEEEIAEQLKKDVPDTLVEKIYKDTYPDGSKDPALLKEAEKTFEQRIADDVAKKSDEFLKEPEYTEARDLYFASEEFAAAVETRFEKEKEGRYFDSLYEIVNEKLKEDIESLKQQLTDAIKAESKAVTDKYGVLFPDTAPDEKPGKKPAEEPSGEPAEESSGEPTEESSGEPTETSLETSGEQSGEASGEASGEEPGEEIQGKESPLSDFKKNFCQNFNDFKRKVRDKYYEVNGKPKS